MTFNIVINAYLSLKYFCHSEKTGARGFNLNFEVLNNWTKENYANYAILCATVYTKKNVTVKNIYKFIDWAERKNHHSGWDMLRTHTEKAMQWLKMAAAKHDFTEHDSALYCLLPVCWYKVVTDSDSALLSGGVGGNVGHRDYPSKITHPFS